MQVRIQLIRDDGSVVIDLRGNAIGPLTWDATMPLAQIAISPGLYIASLEYKPMVVYRAEEPRANPYIQPEAME